jgi:predicted RNA-binding protein YlqC (UPF0109 family)
MAELNYESLVAELVKPLVTHPEDVKTSCTIDGDKVLVKALVNPDDLGRVIGKKGRVASAIRTIAHAAAIRQKQNLDIEFDANEN